MDAMSDAAEYWIRLTEAEFAMKIDNIENCLHENDAARALAAFGYASPSDARRAMLRLVYLRGRADATPARTFEQDVQAVEASREHPHTRAMTRLLK